MAHQTVKDPTHPDFPHGTSTGANRGCNCRPCRLDLARRKKATEVRRRQGICNRWAPPEVAARVRKHIDRLLAQVPDANTYMIARAAGVAESTVTRVRDGGRLTPKVASAILAATPASLDANRGLIPAERIVFLVRTMQAAGWPLRWQAREADYSGVKTLLTRYERGQTRNVHATVAARIEALAARVGDRDATLADGLGRSAIAQAKSSARGLGYYPVRFYDEDGNLDPRSIPDHPWSIADENAARDLEALRALLRGEYVPRIVAREVEHGLIGPDEAESRERAVDRLKGRVGLRFDHDPFYDFNTIRPDSQDAAARVRAVLDAYDDDGLDPLLGVLRLCAYDKPHVPRDHPGYLAYAAEREAERVVEAEAEREAEAAKLAALTLFDEVAA